MNCKTLGVAEKLPAVSVNSKGLMTPILYKATPYSIAALQTPKMIRIGSTDSSSWGVKVILVMASNASSSNPSLYLIKLAALGGESFVTAESFGTKHNTAHFVYAIEDGRLNVYYTAKVGTGAFNQVVVFSDEEVILTEHDGALTGYTIVDIK